MSKMENQSIFQPKNWETKRIEDVCKKSQYGWTTSAKKTGKICLLRTTDITSGTINWDTVPFCKELPKELNKYLLEKNDILISRAGSIGVSIIIKNPKKSVFASYLIRFKTNETVYPDYFYFFLKSPRYWKFIYEKKSGIALANINATKINQISFPLPPLPTQKKIVSKIKSLFSKIAKGTESLNQVKVLLERYRQSVLKDAFDGKLTEKWRAENKGKVEPASALLKKIREERKKKLGKKYKELPPVDKSQLPELPEGWEWCRLESLCDFITKGTTPQKKFLSIQKSGSFPIPFLKVYNLTFNGTLNFTHNPTFTSKESHNKFLNRSKCFPGDVLMNIVGPPLGKVSIIPPVLNECNVNQAIVIYRPQDYLINTFLANALLTPSILHWALKRQKTTAGQHNLTLEICRDLPIPLPSIAEQKDIVFKIDQIFIEIKKLNLDVSSHISSQMQLKNSILKFAFEGKLIND